VWLGGFCQWKIPVTPSEIKPTTFWLVALCFNQLHHCVPHVPAYTSWKRALHVQQNSFNLTSGNSDILIIGHLRRVVPRLEVLFTSKKLHHWNRETSGTCLKKAYKGVCINCCGIRWLLVSYSIKFFSYEDTRKHRRGPWWSCASRWSFLNGILISCTAQV